MKAKGMKCHKACCCVHGTHTQGAAGDACCILDTRPRGQHQHTASREACCLQLG